MRWSEQQHVSVFHCTCQYFIVNCSRTCLSRCVLIDAHRGNQIGGYKDSDIISIIHISEIFRIIVT
jgi:hypothetical protein